jgi:hypothetical protein
MKRVLSLSALVCTLLAAGQAGAENWSQQLSPKKPDNAFKIVATLHKDEAEGDVFHFSVTVGLKDDAFGLRNHKRVLRIFNGKEYVSSCEVQPTGLDGARIYSFRVSPKYLEKSTFKYTDWDDGNTAEFWFYLKDFADAKDKNEQVKELQAEKAKLEARLAEVEAQLKKLHGAADAGKDLEEAARQVKFYGTTLRLIKSKGVAAEWSSTPMIDRQLLEENADRLGKLRAQPYPEKNLIALMKHDDALVRTLAADLLAKSEGAKVRPLLAPLQNDKAPTFPRRVIVGYDCGPAGVWYPDRHPAQMQPGYKTGPTQPQTVGDVVKELLSNVPEPK